MKPDVAPEISARPSDPLPKKIGRNQWLVLIDCPDLHCWHGPDLVRPGNQRQTIAGIILNRVVPNHCQKSKIPGNRAASPELPFSRHV